VGLWNTGASSPDIRFSLIWAYANDTNYGVFEKGTGTTQIFDSDIVGANESIFVDNVATVSVNNSTLSGGPPFVAAGTLTCYATVDNVPNLLESDCTVPVP
jgi:hypothetical protein